MGFDGRERGQRGQWGGGGLIVPRGGTLLPKLTLKMSNDGHYALRGTRPVRRIYLAERERNRRRRIGRATNERDGGDDDRNVRTFFA